MQTDGERWAALFISGLLAFVLVAAVSTDQTADAQGQGKSSIPPAARSTDDPNKPDREDSPVVEIDGVKVASGEFVLTYKNEQKFEADDGAIREKDKGAKESSDIPQINARLIEFDYLKGEDKADEMKARKAELENRGDVETVDFNVLAELAVVPNDTNVEDGARRTPSGTGGTGAKALPESGGVPVSAPLLGLYALLVGGFLVRWVFR